jgi:predicted permease
MSMSQNREERPLKKNNFVSQLIEDLWQDVRYAVRMLVKNPGFTLLVVLCLALGIGANSAIFSLANTLLLRQLPIEKPEEVVVINRGIGEGPPSSYPDYVDYRDGSKSFTGLAATSTTPLNFSNGAQTEVILGEIVTGNYFTVLGVKAILGRTFVPEEDKTPGANPVAVINHRFWERRFNSDPNLIGKTLTLNGQAFTIIGIAPEQFTGSMVMFNPDVWVPMMMQAQLIPTHPDWLNNRRVDWLMLMGRLKPGVSIEQAEADLNLIDNQLAKAHPDVIHEQGASRALSLSHPTGIYIPHLRRMISMVTSFLMALVALVLLIACANVINILLARATARQTEIAIRLSLGAGRGRLIRQLLTESFVIAALGGAAGLLVTWWLTKLMSAYRPPIPPPYAFAPDLQVDTRVLLFTLVLSVATGIIFGLVPALQASRPDLVKSLKDEASSNNQRSRRFSLRNIIVIAQVAVSLVLLISAALFVRSLQKMQGVDPGFKTDNAFLLNVDLDLQGYTKVRGREFYRQLTERLGALPGVQAVSMVNFFPLGFESFDEAVLIEGREPPREGEQIYISTYTVDPGFFQMMNIPIVRGSNFTGQEREDSPGMAIINERMALRFWPNEEAIGKRFRFEGMQGPLLEVIGIAKNSKYRSLGEPPRSVIYISQNQEYTPAMNILVRTSGDPSQTIVAARKEVQSLDANLPIKALMTFDQAVDSSLWRERIGASLLGMFGFLGLVLTTAGLYGVIAYSVVRRTHEIGIRLALGAKPKDVVRMVVKQGFVLIVIGLVVGLILSFIVSRLLASVLYGVVADPVPFLGVPLLVILIALLACYIPARRAAKLKPLVALRTK